MCIFPFERNWCIVEKLGSSPIYRLFPTLGLSRMRTADGTIIEYVYLFQDFDMQISVLKE